jgi:hypothetical protein
VPLPLPPSYTGGRGSLSTQPAPVASATTGTGATVLGIGGIASVERRMAEQHTHSAQYINEAFDDLAGLMNMAQSMVSLAKSVSDKLRLRQGEITQDEVIFSKNIGLFFFKFFVIFRRSLSNRIC